MRVEAMKKANMKIQTLFLLAAALTFTRSSGQSFEKLHAKFAGDENVFSISANGFITKTTLRLAGASEYANLFKARSVRLMSIPKSRFTEQEVTVNGFRKVVQKDQFELLATIRDPRDYVEVYMKEAGRHNRYVAIIEDADEVVVVELLGQIDFARLNKLENATLVKPAL